ncbi:Hypothetical_protein [Hexamita inflata]|uniref:Hypothetical_protein n=1 Tax=Hexamita inflata TaxID=28002 RepID=A0AA86R884_9EUKA|nr:Hypothetical protein HINF_LOCUS55687 [Hexamita inflata]
MMNVSKLNICTNIKYQINNGNDSLVSITEQPNYSCENICDQQTPIYGLCQMDLINGYLDNINKTKYCVHPLIFNDYECVCSQGYILNGTICINFLSKLTNLDQYIFENFSTLNNNLQNNISNIKNQLITTKDDLYNYFSFKISNCSQYVNSKFDDLQNKHNQLELFVSQKFSSLQIETYNLQSNITLHKVISDQLRVDLQLVNSTLTSQIQSVYTNLQTLNNTLQTQYYLNLESFSSLTFQLTSLKSEVISNNTQLQAQINNVNTINNAQNTEITLIKNQLVSLSIKTCILSDRGYCTSLNQCCVPNYTSTGYVCYELGIVPQSQCGTFIF